MINHQSQTGNPDDRLKVSKENFQAAEEACRNDVKHIYPASLLWARVLLLSVSCTR
jgi:hypothetical protein